MDKMRRRMGITVRLFGSFALFAVVMLLLLWLFQIVFLDSFYRYIKTSGIHGSADSVVQNIDSESLPDLIERISEQQDTCVHIIDAQGEELLETEPYRHYCELQPLTQEEKAQLYARALESDGPITAFRTKGETTGQKDPSDQDQGADVSASSSQAQPHDPDEQHFVGKVPPEKERFMQSIQYGIMAERADGSQVLVLLSTNITPVTATVDTLKVQLIYVTAIMLLLAGILAFFLSRRISRPIIRLNRQAKQLATGDYGTVFDAAGYREVDELSDTLNDTARELSKVEDLRRELIANISHDLRTPLTMITGYAEVMRDIPGESTPENLQIIIDESKRLSVLVTDLLSISQMRTGEHQLALSAFDLTQSIREILTRYSKLTQQDGYDIRFEYDGEAWVRADVVKLSQVVYNLINNAINYTGEDKRVTVRQVMRDGVVRVEVCDTGPGIAPEELPYIWDRYYRSGKPHKRAVIGTGLGLSIVKTVLQLHGAAYSVESGSEGSTFWFELPVCRPEAQA